MTIGYKIRKLREDKNYTQQYMADQLGITQRAYSMMESDDIKPSNDKLLKISELMEVDLVKLLTLDLDRVTFKDHSNNNGGVNISDKMNINTSEVIEALLKSKDEVIKLQADKIHLLEEKLKSK